MKLHNSLTKQIETFEPLDDKTIRIYSCGPTTYDHSHIGNLSSFIVADTLRRVLAASFSDHHITHVMNFTDVDDKTITRSQHRYPDDAPEQALQQLTRHYETVFLSDMQAIGNDTTAMQFVRATESMDAIRTLITELYRKGIAYIAGDGVYFSIDKYRSNGKTYGQLTEITSQNTSAARINNDEYDKNSVHDFALWKLHKSGEPAWDFSLDEHDLMGRPGWHIECSAMSSSTLGQPFDIHTGGIDLLFPHHENEIAQSTAASKDSLYARFFLHNEHLLVDGRKMSKSLSNFYNLDDVQEHAYEPLAFRLMVLQAHYQSQANFSWTNLEATQNRLQGYRAMADRVWQPVAAGQVDAAELQTVRDQILEALQNNLDTPRTLVALSRLEAAIDNGGISTASQAAFRSFLNELDAWLGLDLSSRADIDDAAKAILAQREQARQAGDWDEADRLRDQLRTTGIEVRDTPTGQVWSRLAL